MSISITKFFIVQRRSFLLLNLLFSAKFSLLWGISKVIFLDYFSSSFLGQNFSHIPFWPGVKLYQSKINYYYIEVGVKIILCKNVDTYIDVRMFRLKSFHPNIKKTRWKSSLNRVNCHRRKNRVICHWLKKLRHLPSLEKIASFAITWKNRVIRHRLKKSRQLPWRNWNAYNLQVI